MNNDEKRKDVVLIPLNNKSLTQDEMPGEDPVAKMTAEYYEGLRKHASDSGDLTHLLNQNGTGGTNGMGHSTKNLPHYGNNWWNNFPHRTEAEKIFNQALYQKMNTMFLEKGFTFTFSPLPVFSKIDRGRLELDFLILWSGHAFVVELDGDSHIEKSHFDEEQILKPLRDNFIDVIRVRSIAVPSLQWAQHEVENLFNYFERRLANK